MDPSDGMAARQEPYARYRIRQYEGGLEDTPHTRRTGQEDTSYTRKTSQEDTPHTSGNYEEVVRRHEEARQGHGRNPSMKTTVTSFSEGLRRPAQMFGSLKKVGQRFVGADQIQESIQGSLRRMAGRAGAGKCQCRHHQQKQGLIGQVENCRTGEHKSREQSEEREERRGNERVEGPSKGQNRAFLEAKRVFRGDGRQTGNLPDDSTDCCGRN